MKKKFILLCVACLFIMGLAVNASAAANKTDDPNDSSKLTVTYSESSVTGGDTFTATVALADAHNLGKLVLAWTWDVDVLELQNATVGSVLSGANLSDKDSDGIYDGVTWTNTADYNTNINGTLLTLKFGVKEGAYVKQDDTVVMEGKTLVEVSYNTSSDIYWQQVEDEDATDFGDYYYVNPTIVNNGVTLKHTHSAAPTVDKLNVAQGDEATCSTVGKGTYVCEYCNETVTVEIPKDPTNHESALTKTEAKAATCTEAGNKEYWFCDSCKNYYSDAEGKTPTTLDEVKTAALGHSYDNGKVTTEATCTTAGVKTYTCTVCDEKTEGHTKTEAIAALGHDPISNKDGKAATCAAAGHVETYTCSRCEMTFIDKDGKTVATETNVVIAVDENAHDYVSNNDAVEATTSAEGHVETFTCAVCGEVFIQDEAGAYVQIGTTEADGTVKYLDSFDQTELTVAKLTDTSKKDDSKKDENKGAPKTGDESRIVLWAGVMTFCLAAVAMLLKKALHRN